MSKPPKRSVGQPTKYTPELLQTIGERLGQGESLTSICRGLPVCDDTVRNWMAGDSEINRAIARAREDGESAIAYRLRATARGKGEDAGGDSTGDVQRDKLIIETDLKLLAKFNPKRWGDKVDHNHSGGITVHLDAADAEA